MLSLDLSNLYTIHKNNSSLSLSKTDILSIKNKHLYYTDKVNSRQQGFTELPFDLKNLSKIQAFAKGVHGKYDTIVILGIGGSILGPKCILDCLYNQKSKIKVICVDNIDPYKIAEIDSDLNYSKTLFLVQTKSGSTPETIAQYAFFKDKIEKHSLVLNRHLVFVTDPGHNFLRRESLGYDITVFDIPANVGGRFSVLSSVGLLISELVGLRAQDLLSGAKYSLENYSTQALEFAFMQYSFSKKRQNINVIMPYSSRLAKFSEWTVQLISESLGKQFDLDDKVVNAGITPLPAIGATDQHSQLQLFKEGPNDKLLIFINILDHIERPKIPEVSEPALSYLSGKTFQEMIQAEFLAVTQSLTESARPNVNINIDKINEFSLGELFMFFELSTAFLGEMLNINTFDQPGVERSKILTKEKLSDF